MSQRKLSAEEILQILEEGEKAGAGIAEACRRHQIPPSTYHSWRKQVREAAKEALTNGKRRSKKEDVQKEKSQVEIRRLRAVIAEITVENLTLKKTLGEL